MVSLSLSSSSSTPQATILRATLVGIPCEVMRVDSHALRRSRESSPASLPTAMLTPSMWGAWWLRRRNLESMAPILGWSIVMVPGRWLSTKCSDETSMVVALVAERRSGWQAPIFCLAVGSDDRFDTAACERFGLSSIRPPRIPTPFSMRWRVDDSYPIAASSLLLLLLSRSFKRLLVARGMASVASSSFNLWIVSLLLLLPSSAPPPPPPRASTLTSR
mmetsp:Transcript_15270/g.31652  ORF Transcript_15270/g.31652 Transcript_15270/m.31652 type:complete len:219 (-) Transcript_15270:282-938(-)